ncbi:hypothetical protein ABPG75_012859 [Micractinium tetrahymenae]
MAARPAQLPAESLAGGSGDGRPSAAAVAAAAAAIKQRFAGREAEASLGSSTSEGSVLAGRLQNIRALPEGQRPGDAAAWLRCEELQEELRGVLAGWRDWPADGRCDDSLRALALLFAAADAAPAGLDVFLPTKERQQWDTWLFGPALLPAGGGRRQHNRTLHAAIWGAEHIRMQTIPDQDARPEPDDLLKFIGVAYLWSFPGLAAAGSEEEYERAAQSYVLCCKCAIAVQTVGVRSAVAARLTGLVTCLTVDDLDHFLNQQKVIIAGNMFVHPFERQHRGLQCVVHSACQRLLRLRPTSLRTRAISAIGLLSVNWPADAGIAAFDGVRLAEEQRAAGSSGEAYHEALLWLALARTMAAPGSMPSSAVPVAPLSQALENSKACRERCRFWLPTALKQELRMQRQMLVGLTDEQLEQAAGHGAQDSCPCPACAAQRARRCAGCANVVVELKKCGSCRAVGYCSWACQKKHWREGHRDECARLAASRAGRA